MPFSKLAFQLFEIKFIIKSHIAQTNNTKQAQSATPTVISRTELLVTSGTVPFKVSTLPVPHSVPTELCAQKIQIMRIKFWNYASKKMKLCANYARIISP